MNDLVVAKTILTQLGGNHFRVMTGAKNCTAGDNSLIFTLPGGGGFCKNGINKVVITLMPSDTYKMEFMCMRKFERKYYEVHEAVYCDKLCEVFEAATGLRTRLGRAA